MSRVSARRRGARRLGGAGASGPADCRSATDVILRFFLELFAFFSLGVLGLHGVAVPVARASLPDRPPLVRDRRSGRCSGRRAPSIKQRPGRQGARRDRHHGRRRRSPGSASASPSSRGLRPWSPSSVASSPAGSSSHDRRSDPLAAQGRRRRRQSTPSGLHVVDGADPLRTGSTRRRLAVHPRRRRRIDLDAHGGG